MKELFEIEEIEEQVKQAIETLLRSQQEGDSMDVCGFEMIANWDGKSVFEFAVEIDGVDFQLNDYMSDFDFYDLLTIDCTNILDEMADDIVNYVAEKLGVE